MSPSFASTPSDSAACSWASLAGYPSTHAAIAASQTNAASYFLTPATRYAGHWVSSVMSYLIITGSFACGMAFHNTTARYLYSLGREGLAPKALGRTHPKWKTRLAPLISFCSQAYVVYLLFTNISFLGGGYNYANWLGPIDAVVVVAGVGSAFYFRRRVPAKYEQAGRLINEGL